MTIEEGYQWFVMSRPAVQALTQFKLYYQRAPDKAVCPFGVFKKITGRREVTHGSQANLAERRLQLSVRSGNAKEANDIADIIANELDGYAGPMGANGEIPQVACIVDNEIDYEEPETRMHNAVVDTLLMYRRA